MAVIGKIRQRSGLLVLIIGASIVLFLIMDATNSQSSILKGRKDSVGYVNGTKITANDFSKKLDDNIKGAEDQMRGQSLNEEQKNQVREQTWKDAVNEIIFNKIYDKLGINVTPDEMSELAMGTQNVEDVHPQIRQAFTNPQTRQFDVASVRGFLQNLDQDDPNSEPGTKRKQWLKFEAEMKKSQFQQKYNNLIAKAMYAPTWLAEAVYTDQGRAADLKFVVLPYAEVADADVKVTDDDLQKYLNDHSAKFKQDEETRKLQYVTFPIFPSATDSANTIKALEDKRAEFVKGEKASDDSMFAKIYSETPFDEVYYDKDKLAPTPVRDSLFSQKVGTVLGPYLENGKFVLAKISDRKMISDSVHVRQIKFSFSGISKQEEANAKFMTIDSIFKQIDSLKGDFGKFAAAFSDDDPMVKMRGGDIGWVKQGQKDKMYNNIIFYRAQKGKTYKDFSQTDYSYYLFQVVEDKPTKLSVQATYFSKDVLPSAETEKNITTTATTFVTDNQDAAKFKVAAEKLHARTVSPLKRDAYNIDGLGASRDVVKWAFTAKKGDVSTMFNIDKKLVVVLLEDVRAKGLPDLASVRDAIKPAVIKEKKFELLAKKINDAKAANIDDLAAKLGKTAEQADKVTLSAPRLGASYEGKVAATALLTPAGKLSPAVEGNAGVYAVQTIAVTEPEKLPDYSNYANSLRMQFAGKARYAQDVERKLSTVEDTRFDFNY